MKSNIHLHRVLAAIVAAVGVAAGQASAVPADQQGQDPRVYSVNEAVLGMTYGDWSAAWWQYFLPIPQQSNPFNANVSTCGDQSAGPVFFLAGAPSSSPVNRSCTVPAGMPIMFPLFNAECSTIEKGSSQGSDEAQLRACAAGFGGQIDTTTFKASIDGTEVTGDLSTYRVQSPVYSFTLPPHFQDFVFAPIDSTKLNSPKLSVSDGYWLLLKPLPSGQQHVLHFEAASFGLTINMTYTLTVQ